MPQLGQAIGPRADCHGICFLSDEKTASGDARQAARAIDALRRGWPIRVDGKAGSLHLTAIETATDTLGVTGILLSQSRAATLKLANQRMAADVSLPVLIKAPADLNAPLALTIADPSLDMRYPMKGPFAAEVLPDAEAALAAIERMMELPNLPATPKPRRPDSVFGQ